jgi:hypothetical protein
MRVKRMIRCYVRLMRFLVGLLAAVALVTVGCGTDGPERVSANTDASALLRSTVQNLSNVKSATVDLKLTAPHGTARLTGPFAAAEAKGELPRFALNATLTSGARTESAGATWTGEKGYATLDGVSYEVPSLLVQSFGGSLQQASPQTALDVSRWVTNPRNEGAADVAGVETVKLTGGVDVKAFLADVEKLSASLGSLQGMLGGGGHKLSLTPADRRQAADAVKDGTVEVYTGAEDSILRRLVVSATIEGKPVPSGRPSDSAGATMPVPSGRPSDSAGATTRVSLELTLAKVGEDVSISDVRGARPFSELATKFGRARIK